MAFESGITRNALAIRPHGGVFERVITTFRVRGGTVVNYWLDAIRFDTPGPYAFFLEWAEHPDADFIQVAGPTSGNLLVDLQPRKWSKLPQSVYRVLVSTSSGDFLSDAVYALGQLNLHDFLIVRAIIRREYLLLTQYTGTKGLYLARMQWGELCPVCTDHNTEMVTDSHCAVCFGTGFVGGYHAPSTLFLGEERTKVRAHREGNIGVRADQSQVVRGVACPFLTAKDIWINLSTDERWSVESKQELAAFRGKPLVYAVELRLIEPNNIAYDLPVTVSSSSNVL